MHETAPINDVNWYEAYAFCIWDGAFLPSKRVFSAAGALAGLQTSDVSIELPDLNATLNALRALAAARGKS